MHMRMESAPFGYKHLGVFTHTDFGTRMLKPHIAFGKGHLAALLVASALISTTPAVVTLADTQTTSATTLEQTAASSATTRRSADGATQGVEYLDHSWDGKQVCKRTESRSDALPFPEDGRLDNHCYVVDKDTTIYAPVLASGDTQLIVRDDCTLNANGGIAVDGTLGIYGDGHIVASGEMTGVPGIGGDGKLAIHGGSVEATGGDLCPGIGTKPGVGSSDFSVTVYGGDINATGGPCGAGIGGGEASTCGAIRIFDGRITSTGGKLAAGIGDGNGMGADVRNSHNGRIEIWGGTVEAHGGEKASGIGGGADGGFGTIAVHGGTVTANGGSHGAGIGAMSKTASNDSTILIDGGNVTATAGTGGDGISSRSSRGTVSILGGDVSAYSSDGIATELGNAGAMAASDPSSNGLAVSGTLEVGPQAHGCLDTLDATCGTLELGTTLRFGDRSSIAPGHYVFSQRFADPLEYVEFGT